MIYVCELKAKLINKKCVTSCPWGGSHHVTAVVRLPVFPRLHASFAPTPVHEGPSSALRSSMRRHSHTHIPRWEWGLHRSLCCPTSSAAQDSSLCVSTQQPQGLFSICIFEAASFGVAQADLELETLWPLPSWCWNYRHVVPYPALDVYS